MKHSNKLIAALCAGLLVSGFAVANASIANLKIDGPSTDLKIINTTSNLTLSNFQVSHLLYNQSDCGAKCTDFLVYGSGPFTSGKLTYHIQRNGTDCAGDGEVDFTINGSAIHTEVGSFKLMLSASAGCSPDPYFVYAKVVENLPKDPSDLSYTLTLSDDGIAK